MQYFIQALRDTISSKNENLRERMFCIINLVAAVLGFWGLIETIPMVKEKYMVLIILSVLFLSIIVSFYLLLKYHLFEAASVIMGATLSAVVFPGMFNLSGGLEGGAPVSFSLNIIYGFIMFQGKWLYILLGLDVVSVVATYLVSYFYPEMVSGLLSREAMYIDSMYSVIVVGFAVGFVLKIYINAYVNQRTMVEEQNKKIAESSSSKDHFFASMSHEIRTPINTIIGLNEMILRGDIDDETVEYARNVQNAGKLLLSLVNDILDLSQMEMGRMEIVPVEYRIDELIYDLVDIIQIQANDKNLELILDIDKDLPSELLGDKKRIEQVMINLLTNAVKYTNKGSITLSVYLEKKTKTDATIKLSVADTGIGIRKEDINDLYEIFRRVDTARNEKVEGSGLGLAITKQLVDMMGGEMIVDSIYMKGSIFTVLLNQPIVNANRVGYIENKRTSSIFTRTEYKQLFEAPEARVLIVDDNNMNINVVSKLLSATRIKIDTATSGMECLEKTQNKFYHVILLDHMMPGMDGVETIKKIRKQNNGLCRDTIIIAMTANSFSGAKQFYSEHDFDEYVEKPINGEMLEKTILSYLPPDIVEYRRDDAEVENLLPTTERKKRKKKIIITTDCVAELPQNLIQKYDIGLMYLYIKTDKGRFADTREISSDNLEQFMSDKNTIAMADSVSVEEYEQFFSEQLTKAEEIIHISVASNTGKTYSVAVSAAESFGHVHVIDSKQISCGQSLLVLSAAKLLQENLSVEDMIKEIKWAREKIVSQFIIPSIDIFYKNGYTTKRTMKFFNAISAHPILNMKNSSITPVGFKTGEIQQVRKHFIKSRLRKKKKINDEIVFVSHVALSVKEQKMVLDEINKNVNFKNVFINKASFSTAVNSGIGSLGFAYYLK